MHLELRLRMAERGQRGDGRDLAFAQRQAEAAVDVAEGEFDDVAAEVGRDVAQRVDDALAVLR